MINSDKRVINDFGKEWQSYNQNILNNKELNELFNNYFNIFPFDLIDKNSEGFDMGCGSGRWAILIAPKVKVLNCIEPSEDAIKEAKLNLKKFKNCIFENKDVMNSSLKNESQDFGYALGVLHHMPDTALGLKNCIKKLKKGAPFLLYLYYKFDNKPIWFRVLWIFSDILRRLISRLPFKIKLYVTKLIALFIYFPLANLANIFEKLGISINNFPLSSYRKTSFYTMQTDSLDRFGTKLEHRFTKNEITKMMVNSGLTNIQFSDQPPYWVAVGEKK